MASILVLLLVGGKQPEPKAALRLTLGLILAHAVLAVCPPRWVPYQEEICLYLSVAPALTWTEAQGFCQDHKGQLVVVKDHRKQMFLTDLAEGAKGRAAHYWIGLAREEARAQHTWVDGTALSQNWYSHWLPGHPKEEGCVQLLSVFTGQWRDWDCHANSSFICETQVTDAFPGFVQKAGFRSRCYTFHFPSSREQRSWQEAQSICRMSKESLATIHDEEENAFLSDAFPKDGWHMWIGLHFGMAWHWSDGSSLGYSRWHPEKPPSQDQDQCAVLNLRPAETAQHGTWETWPCSLHPIRHITGFICQRRAGFCTRPESVRFLLPGGMGPHATADVTFALRTHTTCILSLTSRRVKTETDATLFWLGLRSNATHVHIHLISELGGSLVQKMLPGVPFDPGLHTWSFITFLDGFASFYDHQEHFRLSDAPGLSFASLSFLQIRGVAVVNASLEHRLSSEAHFPGGTSGGIHLPNAIRRYLGNFTLGLWLRSAATSSPKMCLVSYGWRWKRPEFALFLLSPTGLEFHLKGSIAFSETGGPLLDGLWHHVAVSVSNVQGILPARVFVDGEPWQPSSALGNHFWQKGLSLGGGLSLGKLDVDNRGSIFYQGHLSEVNLWDRALSGHSLRPLAASRTRWKYPGNVVSWAQLVAVASPPVEIHVPLDEGPEVAMVWFGCLRLSGKTSVLCANPEQDLVYVAPTLAQCPGGALWGLQPDGHLRSVGDPPACLWVALDGASMWLSPNCSAKAVNSFRLLPDQHLQNLHSGLCLSQEARSGRLFLGQCSPQALCLALDWDVFCPQSQGWRSRGNKGCLFLVLEAALGWSEALTFCRRFHGGSLVSLRGTQDLEWLQKELKVSAWTGLHSRGGGGWSWADGTPFDPLLQRFLSSWAPPGMDMCALALPSGFLKAEPCHRPHRWICQTPRWSGQYESFPGKSFYGALSVEETFSSLPVAQRECTALGHGCTAVLSTPAGHRLSLGRRFVVLEDLAVTAHPTSAVHVKTRCSPGYSGPECQSMCPPCQPPLSCNPLTGLCDGFLYYRKTSATYASRKCLPHSVWVFERDVCLSVERFATPEEAGLTCQRYLGATVWQTRHPAEQGPNGTSGTKKNDFLWACQRAEEVDLPSFREKLLVSPQGSTRHWRHRTLEEARDACHLQGKHCTGLLTLHGAHFMVGGTVLVDSPGSQALLYVQAACSPGFCGDLCQRSCSPCLTTRTYNPLTGHCDHPLRCLRGFSPSCLHGLVHPRCPQQPGWWFWGGHCYYVAEGSAKDWPEAKEACQAYGQGTDLLTLSSTKEKDWVAAMVQEGSWTGLNDADEDGVWTWAVRDQPAQPPPPWLSDVQLRLGGCLEIGGPQRGQKVSVSLCSQPKPWVCEGPWAPWSSCPAEKGWTPWNGSCYFWDPLAVGSWHEALGTCRRFRKTELLYLTSARERDWVRGNFGGSFWTGLNDLQEESVFRWTTQELLGKEMVPYLQDDVADGGRKDCVWFDGVAGLLRDASCDEKRPFLCKGSEATDWFEERPGHGMEGLWAPWRMYPSAESLAQAKRECLLQRSVCRGILQAGTGFFLLSSLEGVVAVTVASEADSRLFIWTICAQGFSGPGCRTASVEAPRPDCDCSGRFQTTAERVCGVPVKTCMEDCKRGMEQRNCSLCLPACTETSLRGLDPEELALITMVQFKVSQGLNLTAEDERDRGDSSKIIYDAKYP